MSTCGGRWTGQGMTMPDDIAAAERRGEVRGMERAAELCDQQSAIFASTEYATGQPLSSFSERFACSRCAAIIREAAEAADWGRDE